MRKILILFCFVVSGLAQAQVYRSVGKDGSVTFSDQPSDGAVKVQVKKLETIKSVDTPVPPSSSTGQQAQQNIYTGISITSPADDQAIRENAGNLSVSVSVTPGLKPSHKLVLYLDGKKYSTGTADSFSLHNIDRGTHQLRVAVVDNGGHQLIDSKSVTFHMLRHSVLMPKPKPKPAQSSN